MAKTDPKRLKFLMDVDEAIQAVEKEHPSNNTVTKIKDRFYSLANQEFTRSTLREIHESAIEDILEKQAQNFYENFPDDIREELVNTFIEMEHQRRRDNFFGFCFSIFKQIECVVVRLLKKEQLFNKFSSERHKPLYFYNSSKSLQINFFEYWNSNNTPPTLRDDKYYDTEVFPTMKFPKFQTLDFKIRFRIVLYYFYFTEKVPDYVVWNEIDGIRDEIQQVRNVGHGGKISDIRHKQRANQNLNKQEKTLISSYENQYVNYLRYQGFLADFMRKVSNSPNLNLI